MRIYVLTMQNYLDAHEPWTTELVTTDYSKIRERLDYIKLVGHCDCAVDIWEDGSHILREYYEYDITGKWD